MFNYRYIIDPTNHDRNLLFGRTCVTIDNKWLSHFAASPLNRALCDQTKSSCIMNEIINLLMLSQNTMSFLDVDRNFKC